MVKMLYPLLALSTSFVISTSSYAQQASMFAMKSSSFENRQTIPTLYTCDGRDLSPQLSWNGAPDKTVAYVLICSDPDAPTGIWYHWVVYNIPRSVSQLSEGDGLPGGASYGKNSWGRPQYNGPCPPRASIHRYNFTLYALDTRLSLAPGASAAEVLQAIHGHVVGKTMVVGVFGH